LFYGDRGVWVEGNPWMTKTPGYAPKRVVADLVEELRMVAYYYFILYDSLKSIG
jgi:hypothetical protein